MAQVKVRFTPEAVEFLFEPPLAFPLSSVDAALGAPIQRVLESLWFEERIEEISDGYRLPFTELYRLHETESNALGLPSETTAADIAVRSLGYPGSSGFSLAATVSLPSEPRNAEILRQGPVVTADERKFLLPQESLPLLQLIDRGPPENTADQLLYLASVKQAAERCGAGIDRYLENQDVVTPESIGVDVEVEAPDRIFIRPVAEGVDTQFPNFDRGRTRGTYTRRDGTRRQRLVLGTDHRRIVDEVKRRPELTGSDVARFFDNPEAFLPDGIDLERFSRRVRGLIPRRYNSQPYVRLRPSEDRNWFALDIDIDLTDTAPTTNTGAVSGGSVRADRSRSPREPNPGLPSQISPEEYARLCEQVLASGDQYVLREDAWIEIDRHSAERYLRTWNQAEVDGRGARGFRSVPTSRYVLDVISNLDELEFSTEIDDALPHDAPAYPVPKSLVASLMPHQYQGYRWLRYLHEQNYGGLLADDMGLGKTIQVISLLAYLADAGDLRPALIVVPKSLLLNWQREIARFCPDIQRVYVHQGPARIRQPELISEWDVVLTTYGTLRRDQLILGQVDWSVIACDEAQNVKNPTAQATSAVKGMKAGLRVAMTGTPVENGLSELWCIVDWVQPGKLGSQKQFRNDFERPIQDADAEVRADLASRLRERLIPHYMRRVKDDVVAGLARPEVKHSFVPFGPRQRRLYEEVVQQVRSRSMVPLEALHYLIEICSHPEVFEPSGASISALIDECPKLQETLTVLANVRERGERAVVFTRYRRMQDILQSAIATRFGVHAPVLNGDTAGPRRQMLVDQFNDLPEFGAMILSPEAAGVGLNIVGANHVIHYSRLWNPAKENQATDRVHRIGQTRLVTVYYPIVASSDNGFSTVEQKLDVLLADKQSLARDVVRPREGLSVERDLTRSVFDEEA